MGIGTLSKIDHHSHIHNHSKTVGMGIGTLSEIDHHSHIHNHSKTVGMGIDVSRLNVMSAVARIT